MELEFTKRTNVLFIFILYILGRNMTAAKTCTDCPNITLGTAEESIIYESNNPRCKCSWTLPAALVESDSYIVVVEGHINATLKKFGCVATVAFPEKEYTCDEGYQCQIYQTQTTRCKDSEVFTLVNKTGSPCKEITKFQSNSKKYLNYSSHGSKKVRKLNIRYIPINCDPSSTTTPLPQNLPDRTTLNTNPANFTEYEDSSNRTTSGSYWVDGLNATHLPDRTTLNTNPAHFTESEASSSKTTTESYWSDGLNTTKISTIAENVNALTTTELSDEEKTDKTDEKTEADEVPSTGDSESFQSMRHINLIIIVVPLAILLIIVLIAAVLLILWYRGKKASKPVAAYHEEEEIVQLNYKQETVV